MHEYKRFVRMAFNESDDAVRVTIPDTIAFPSQQAYLHLRDKRTVVVSPNPTRGAELIKFDRKSIIPGCRELRWSNVHGIGPYFRMTPVHYRVEGPDLVLEIPDEEDRLAPKQFGRLRGRKPSSQIAESKPAPATPPASLGVEPVRVVGYGNDFTYNIPIDVMIRLIDELARYKVD